MLHVLTSFLAPIRYYKGETRYCGGFHRAAEKIRTFTAFRPLPPQSSASTSFATAARAANLMIVAILKNDLLNNVKNAEVCDATGSDSGTAVGYITIFLKQP